ncbi:MAG TPA: hypothetical protein VFF30_18320 [Nitrososphaerales archaeon]|nr:hypothetical protein [Nitrososphaerales archaeon]
MEEQAKEKRARNALDAFSLGRDASIVFMRDLISSRLALQEATSPYLFVKREVPIVASYCTYRDAEYLRSSFDSICMYVDAVMILDGRFLDFPELPEDDTVKIVQESASRFDPQYFKDNLQILQKFVYLDIEFGLGPMLEVEKRQFTFEYIPSGSYAFIIDGDEVAIGDVKAGLDFVRNNEDIKIFWVWVEEEGNPGWKPRIIRVEPGLHYGENHWTILNLKNEIVTDSAFPTHTVSEHSLIRDFKIYNFGSKRAGKRGEARIAYRETMRKRNWKEQEIVVATSEEN